MARIFILHASNEKKVKKMKKKKEEARNETFSCLESVTQRLRIKIFHNCYLLFDPVPHFRISWPQQVVLDIQNFDKFPAVKMGVMPGHGQGFMAGHFLDFQGAHIGHKKRGV
jgi:hypothetical protein